MNIYRGTGELGKLRDIIKAYDPQSILVVTGRNSYEICGAKEILNDSLKGYQVTFFNDFEVNPMLKDAERGVKLALKNSVNLILSVGGGSVLDMGKLIKALYSTPDKGVNLARGFSNVIDPKIPMIAIPTTAGSGSESTHFAVVYIEDEKHSLAAECLLPNDVILDGNLILSSSKYQKACNSLDALSQSIESAWAVGSTEKSIKISYTALQMCVSNFVEFVNTRDNPVVAQSMIEASNLAGQAINIAKTTAAHAWSYGLTKKYGIPHGHAVWVTLPKIFEIHATAQDSVINDPRGLKHLKSVMDKLIDILNISEMEDLTKQFKNILASIGIKADIAIDLLISREGRLALSNDINKDRMGNNPVIFSQSHIDEIFKLTLVD